jgi:hypothetical protein
MSELINCQCADYDKQDAETERCIKDTPYQDGDKKYTCYSPFNKIASQNIYVLVN